MADTLVSGHIISACFIISIHFLVIYLFYLTCMFYSLQLSCSYC
uniref:Uncharacterized protein n=1 Tax=Arundo donax TaxID=35708 RepID=A0A0A9B202_ARUDO